MVLAQADGKSAKFVAKNVELQAEKLMRSVLSVEKHLIDQTWVLERKKPVAKSVEQKLYRELIKKKFSPTAVYINGLTTHLEDQKNVNGVVLLLTKQEYIWQISTINIKKISMIG